jgi:hypothetical protein
LQRFKSSLTHYLALKLENERCHAAELLQMNWRVNFIKRKGQRYRAAIKLQRAWRFSRSSSREGCATCIQARWRAYSKCTAIDVVRTRCHARAIQRWYWRLKAQQRKKAAGKIQQTWREFVSHVYGDAATKIQSVWRCKRTKQSLRKWTIYFAGKKAPPSNVSVAVPTYSVHSLVFNPQPPQIGHRLLCKPLRPRTRSIVPAVACSKENGVAKKPQRLDARALLALAAPFAESVVRMVNKDLLPDSKMRERTPKPKHTPRAPSQRQSSRALARQQQVRLQVHKGGR